MTLKIDVVAAMPRAKVTTAITLDAGFRRRSRRPKAASRKTVVIGDPRAAKHLPDSVFAQLSLARGFW
jgi:hypothetical protein